MTAERCFPEPCTEEVRAERLGMTRSCTVGECEICMEGIMEYGYMGELGEIDLDVANLMVLVGENDVARRMRGRGVGGLCEDEKRGPFAVYAWEYGV
jgi:hypothetical protein